MPDFFTFDSVDFRSIENVYETVLHLHFFLSKNVTVTCKTFTGSNVSISIEKIANKMFKLEIETSQLQYYNDR